MNPADRPAVPQDTRPLRELLGEVQEADTPEQRDEAWDEIERRFASLLARVEAAENALRELRPYFDCRCDEAYTGRGLHGSDCLAYEAPGIDQVLAGGVR